MTTHVFLHFNDKTFFEAIWFVRVSDEAHRLIHDPGGSGGGLCDILAALHRPIAGGPWTFAYRFRYGPLDGDPDKDRLSMYGGTSDDPDVGKHLRAAREALSIIAGSLPGSNPLDELLIRGDGMAAAEVLVRQPWAHVRPVVGGPMTKGGAA